MITVNNFFAHWVTEISVTKYRSNKELPPTFSPWEVYQYSDSMLNYLPSDALKTISKTMLYDKTPVYFANVAYDRRNYNAANVNVTVLNAANAAGKKQQRRKIQILTK